MHPIRDDRERRLTMHRHLFPRSPDDEHRSRPPPAAYALRATYRPDGVVLLELIENWYTSLGAAAAPAADAEQIRDVLTAWALRPTPQRSPRNVNRRTSAAWYGLEAEVVSVRRPGARTVSRSSDHPAQFARLFGAASAVPSEELDAFTRALARGVGAHLGIMRRRAVERLAGGAYLPVLEAHLARCRTLGADPRAYRLIEHTLVPILEDEQYLPIAEDSQGRRLFRELEEETHRMYGRCMDLER